jgi:hypothetical protein
MSFKETRFKELASQEEACRKAKIISEHMGDRVEADYYFYKEMVAKRRQKKFAVRVLELPVQHVFGYGTKWEWVLVIWLLTVSGFGFFYWIGNGVHQTNSLVENIYFSVATATTVGYGDYHPKLGFFQLVASFEAVFGTFMWAAFIVLFARRYMR